MIGKLLGAFVGSKLARHSRNVGEPGGALLGVAAMTLVRRLGPAGLIAAAAGGYALKRHNEKRARRSGRLS